MPHRRSPQGVARNYILQQAKFDRNKKESINTVTDDQVLTKLKEAFPENTPSIEAGPEGWIGEKRFSFSGSQGNGCTYTCLQASARNYLSVQ
jgi:hypothetical protein